MHHTQVQRQDKQRVKTLKKLNRISLPSYVECAFRRKAQLLDYFTSPFQIQRATFLTVLRSLSFNYRPTTMACTVCLRQMIHDKLGVNERHSHILQNHHALQSFTLTDE